MGYHKDQYEKTCESCGTRNYVVVFYAGYGPANERERTDCYNCGAQLASEKCGWIHSGPSYERADINQKTSPSKI